MHAGVGGRLVFRAVLHCSYGEAISELMNANFMTQLADITTIPLYLLLSAMVGRLYEVQVYSAKALSTAAVRPPSPG